MVLVLLTEVVILYMQITIVQVGVDLRGPSVSFFAFVAGTAKVAGAWFLTLLI